MSVSELPRILVAASHPWLIDALTQILHKASPEVITADDLETIFAQVRLNPAVVVVEPFAFNIPGLELLQQLRQKVPTAMIIVLIPTEASDYRNTVLRLGADGVVAADCAAVELLPIVKQLIMRTPVVNHLDDQLTHVTGQNAPTGDIASQIKSADCDPQVLSKRASEQLSRRSDSDAPTPSIVDPERD